MMEADGDKEMSRREFLAWVAAVTAIMALPGCAPDNTAALPPASSRPRPQPIAYASPLVEEAPAPRYIYVQQAPAPAPVPTHRAAAASATAKVSAMSRNSWGATPAIPTKMKKMNGVRRITVHHEGSAKPNNDVTSAQVATTLRLIQSQHRSRMGAGDIGYHFIIDRTGCIWQGRDWSYQGAHVSGHNQNNIGIMLLGNFEIQQPTAQQIASLRRLTASLMRKYGLSPQTDLFCHSDFNNTKCPGKNLKPHINAMKRAPTL